MGYKLKLCFYVSRFSAHFVFFCSLETKQCLCVLIFKLILNKWFSILICFKAFLEWMTVCCYICLTNISIMPSCRWTDSLNPCHCFQLAILLGHRSYGRYGTEEPCDIACRFCYWLLAIEDYPHEFSRQGKIHCLY